MIVDGNNSLSQFVEGQCCNKLVQYICIKHWVSQQKIIKSPVGSMETTKSLLSFLIFTSLCVICLYLCYEPVVGVMKSSQMFAKSPPFMPAPFEVQSNASIPYTVGMELTYLPTHMMTRHPVTHALIKKLNFVLGPAAVSTLRRLYSVPMDTESNSDYDWGTLPMVTGASSNHFREALAGVEAHHNNFPKSVLYFYDLGLDEGQIQRLKQLCMVVYRKFDFKIYPPHVRRLHNYAFKALVWQDMLLSHKRFLWMDASLRLQTCFLDLLKGLSTKLERSGVVMLHRSPHTVYAVTAPSLYSYLNTNISKLMRMDSYGGGLLMFQRNQQMMDDVMRWLVLCSLEETCAHPPGANMVCHPVKHNDSEAYVMPYRKCHRFDMSILGILQANTYNFDMDKYSIQKYDPCVQIRRRHRPKVKIDTC